MCYSVLQHVQKQIKKWLHKLAEIAGVDIESYGLDMLKAETDISDLTNDDIVRLDMKEFSGSRCKTISIGQILRYGYN